MFQMGGGQKVLRDLSKFTGYLGRVLGKICLKRVFYLLEASRQNFKCGGSFFYSKSKWGKNSYDRDMFPVNLARSLKEK